MSFKVVVKSAGDKDWVSNTIRFALKIEAEAYEFDLMMRWLAVQETKVEESPDPVTHTFMGRKLAVYVP